MEVYIYRCIAESNKNFIALYNEASWVEKEGAWKEVGADEVRGYYIKYTLEDFIVKQEEILRKIKTLTTEELVVSES